MDMLIDDSICENCLAKNHCDVLPYSNNCNEVRAMAKHDKQVYNKAIDDFVKFANTMPTVEEKDGEIRPMWLEEMAERLKVGGDNE